MLFSIAVFISLQTGEVNPSHGVETLTEYAAATTTNLRINPQTNEKTSMEPLLDYISYISGTHRYLSSAGNETTVVHVAEVHPSLFEALSVIRIEIGTFSVLIIIGFIILLKQIIEGLSSLTEDTAFFGMVKKIEEELMIVGTSSFIFKIVLNTTNFGANVWSYPLEFGGKNENKVNIAAKF